MDLARRQPRDFDHDAPAPRRAPAAATLADLDQVLRFTPPPLRAVPAAGELGSLTGHDISRAIDLVQSAARTIQSADKRAREGDTRTQALLKRATDQLAGAEARIQAAETRAQAAEARAQTAEQRAQAAEQRAEESESRLVEAEDWLRQIFSAMSAEAPQG